MGVEAVCMMSERLGAVEMFWEHSGIALGGTEGLELVNAHSWQHVKAVLSHLSCVNQRALHLAPSSMD